MAFYLIAKYALWGGSIVYAVMTWLLKKHHKAFLISGIFGIVASFIDYAYIYQGHIFVRIFRRMLYEAPMVLSVIAWVLQIIFFTIAIGSCMKKIDASSERKWVVFRWVYPIAMGVAVLLFFILNSRIANQVYILFKMKRFNYVLCYTVNMVLLIILFVLIKKTESKLSA